MPDPPPPSTTTPSGTAPETDEDAAFTAALYSRIHGDQHTDHATTTEATPLLPASEHSEHDDDDTALRASHRWSASRNDHDLFVPPVTKPPVAPPAFVTRVRERLQRELQGVSSNMSSAPHTDGEVTATEANGERAPSATFQGFLARLETDLASQYDRVLQGDLDDLRPPTEGTTSWSTTLQADVPAHAAKTFEARHGVTLDAACAMAQRMVDDVVAGYKAYFEAEQDVVAVAERYDALQAWAHQSKELFAKADTVEGTVTAFDEMVAQYFQTGIDPRSSAGASHNTDGVWTNKMRAAKQAWLNVQAQRHVVDRLQAVVGHACTCKVCFGATVATVLVPCGHTLCKRCAEQVGQCPFCNATFYTCQDIYFG